MHPQFPRQKDNFVFILFLILFPLSLFPSSFTEQKTYLQNEFTFARGISTFLKKKSIVGGEGTKTRLCNLKGEDPKEPKGFSWPKYTLEKACPPPGGSLRRTLGWRVEQAGISAPSPLNQCPCAGHGLHKPQGSPG